MIRRKRKIRKVIEVRRNPVDKAHFIKNSFHDIKGALQSGDIYYLTDLINIYQQGFYCRDCDEFSEMCECEKCDECGHKRCICKFLGDDSKPKDRIRIRKIVWEFIRYMNFEKKYLMNIIPTQYTINSLYDEEFIEKSEVNFLKSLTPESKFPKYTSLMKRLFEIDQ